MPTAGGMITPQIAGFPAPDGVSGIGKAMDGLPPADSCIPPMTTIHVRVREMGDATLGPRSRNVSA